MELTAQINARLSKALLNPTKLDLVDGKFTLDGKSANVVLDNTAKGNFEVILPSFDDAGSSVVTISGGKQGSVYNIKNGTTKLITLYDTDFCTLGLKDNDEWYVLHKSITSQKYIYDTDLDLDYSENADNTIKLQNAINRAVTENKTLLISRSVNVVIPDNKVALVASENSRIESINGAVITISPTDKGIYTILNVKSNAKLLNVKVRGDVENHIGDTGEWGMGFTIKGVKDFELIGCEATHCWGDGFYIGEIPSAPCERGIMVDCKADYNRRQGFSVVSWIKGRMIRPVAKNTGMIKFVQPAYGIDIEPNPDNKFNIDVYIENPYTENNKYGGIQIVPGALTKTNILAPSFNLSISNYLSVDDGTFGALRFANPTGLTNETKQVSGEIQVLNPKIIDSKCAGVDFARWGKVVSPNTTIIDPIILNPNSGNSSSINLQKVGIALFQIEQKGNGFVKIIRPVIRDNKSTKTMIAPIYSRTHTEADALSNFIVIDGASSGTVMKQPLINVDKWGENVSISTNNILYLPDTRYVIPAGYSGTIIKPRDNMDVSDQVGTDATFILTLPDTSLCKGAIIEIAKELTEKVIQIKPNGTDVIYTDIQLGNGEARLRNNYSSIKLKAGVDGWVILENVNNSSTLA
jgi:hypothetical protein